MLAFARRALVWAVAGVMTVGFAAPAAAAVPAADRSPGAAMRPDNRPGPLTARQDARRKAAQELILSGRASPNADGVVQIAADKYFEAAVSGEGRLFTILAEFGSEAEGRFGRVPGPAHNQIPKPNREIVDGQPNALANRLPGEAHAEPRDVHPVRRLRGRARVGRGRGEDRPRVGRDDVAAGGRVPRVHLLDRRRSPVEAPRAPELRVGARLAAQRAEALELGRDAAVQDDRALLREQLLDVFRDAADFWDTVNKQDWAICESVQRGMSSRGFTQGWFAPMEDYSLDIRRWLLPRLGPQ